MTERDSPTRRLAALQRDGLELLAESTAVTDKQERRSIARELQAVERERTRLERQAEALDHLADHWQAVYGPVEGYLALFSGHRGQRRLERPQEAYYPYPDRMDAARAWVVGEVAARREIYQCAHLVTVRRRHKDTAAPIAAFWVDLDHDRIHHEAVPRPSVIVQSSPGRLQAYWRLTAPVNTATAEHANRLLAHRLGADASGWDATQLLRVPGTVNFKSMNISRRPQHRACGWSQVRLWPVGPG